MLLVIVFILRYNPLMNFVIIIFIISILYNRIQWKSDSLCIVSKTKENLIKAQNLHCYTDKLTVILINHY